MNLLLGVSVGVGREFLYAAAVGREQVEFGMSIVDLRDCEGGDARIVTLSHLFVAGCLPSWYRRRGGGEEELDHDAGDCQLTNVA